MIPSQLLIAAIFCSVCVFAQENRQRTIPMQGTAPDSQKVATTIVPLRVGSFGDPQPTVPRDPLARLQSGPQIELRNPDGTTTSVFLPPTEDGFLILPVLPGDAVCLKIRSYLMKRDSKGSDSTHLAGYSTCQPATKYRLRTTQSTSDAVQR